VIGQRKWSILGIAALLTGLATFFSYQQTPVYQSGAAVLVVPVDPVRDTGDPVGLNINTEVEVAGSVAVAEVVAESLDLDIAPTLLVKGLSVDSPTDTEVIQFSYSHENPEEAQRRAQGFARGYLDYRRQTINEQISGSAESLEGELDTLNSRLDALQRELDRLGDDDPRRFTLESEAALLQGLILDRQLARVALQEDISVGNIVEPAYLPESPSSPIHVVNAGFGLFAGLALGIGLAFLRDRMSGRLRSDEEVEVQFGAPILGGIPRIPSWKRRKQAYLVTRNDWGSPSAESYRFLRTNLLSAAAMYETKTIVITSAHIGEGKTATAANLALALARAGKRVTLISADLRRPRLQEFFPIRTEIGLTEVLSGTASLPSALVRSQPVPGHPGMENLTILPSGKSTQDPSELLSSDAMLSVLQELKEESDFVLVDAPPVLPVTDATILARVVDGVLFVIGPQSLTQGTVTSARQQLDKVGANVLGVVLNGTAVGVQESYYTY
jgi:capsular exopolysaccharide synthesis family protein